MPALFCVRHWRRDPAGTAHVCEALFPRASGPLRSSTVTLLCRRGHMTDQANLLSAVTCRTSATSDSYSRRCILLTRRLVVSGHLSTNSAVQVVAVDLIFFDIYLGVFGPAEPSSDKFS